MAVLCVDTVAATGIVASWRARLRMGLRRKRWLSRKSLSRKPLTFVVFVLCQNIIIRGIVVPVEK